MIIILMDDIKWIFEYLPLGVEWRHFHFGSYFFSSKFGYFEIVVQNLLFWSLNCKLVLKMSAGRAPASGSQLRPGLDPPFRMITVHFLAKYIADYVAKYAAKYMFRFIILCAFLP